MCALLPAWLCLLGLLPLEIQSRALTLQNFSHRHRLNLPRTPHKSTHNTFMPSETDHTVATDNEITMGDRNIIWRAVLHKEPPSKLSDMLLDQSDNVVQESLVWHRGSRGRRHTHGGGGRSHSHLMRVGCVLGTCQVQNLSHRLYQLIGQSGREDSSPINPRSPHSYG